MFSTEHVLANDVPKASDLLAHQIRRRILFEQLPVGFALPTEAELVATSGMSRGTVREALRLLETEGLIRVKRGPRGGSRVSAPTVQTTARNVMLLLTLQRTKLIELLDYRLLVEPQAAAWAADRASDEERSVLLKSTEARSDTESKAPHFTDFHLLIASASHNDLIKLTLSALHETVRYETGGERFSHGDLHATGVAHAKIAKAIAEGDAKRAGEAMTQHLLSLRDKLDELGRLEEPIISAESWGTPL